MGANIPAAVSEYLLATTLRIAGLTRIHQGKVRDTWKIPDSDFLLVVATDRISIFDFVLNTLVPGKGEILTATSVFWLTQVLEGVIKHHLVAAGSQIDLYLPTHLGGNSGLQKRAIVVKRCSMKPVEFIYRTYLTGSGLASYKKTGSLFRHPLPPGLGDGAKLDSIKFTPTTKAETGHDTPLSAAQVEFEYPKESLLGSMAYELLTDYATPRGILMPDTKLEFGDYNGYPTLADEVGTPDSSRLWDINDWKLQTDLGKKPTPMDKQFVRDWGNGFGISDKDPENPDDIAFVHGLEVPSDIVNTTADLYQSIFFRLTGHYLQDFQRQFMGIELN